MSWRDHIVVDPAVLVGKPVIKGTRISVELLLDRLADAWSYDDILTAYPHLAREQVQAAVQFASELFKEERFVATAKSSRVMWPGLLVNENFPAPATQALRSSGVDVFSVSEQLPGASDESVLAVACAQARWLVTFDNDYGELLFARRLPAPPAVLLLPRDALPTR